MTEERIAHILSEASNLMKTPHNQEDTRSNEDSKSPNRGQVGNSSSMVNNKRFICEGGGMVEVMEIIFILIMGS